MIPPFYFQKIQEISLSDTSTSPSEADKQLKMAFMSVINSQAELINKLIVNQTYLKKLLYVKCQDNSGLMSDFQYNESKQFLDPQLYEKISKLNLVNQQEMQENFKNINWQKQWLLKVKRQNFQSQQSKQSVQEQSQNSSLSYKVNKFSQTKNIIKNFSKALFRFIQKFRVYVRKVLERENITQQKFHSVLLKFKNKIYTMSKLRELWLPEGNQCHRAFRIISMEYLRKHSLNHIFYSRVINYKIHNKYRRRFYQIIKNPSEFTNLKID